MYSNIEVQSLRETYRKMRFKYFFLHLFYSDSITALNTRETNRKDQRVNYKLYKLVYKTVYLIQKKRTENFRCFDLFNF